MCLVDIRHNSEIPSHDPKLGYEWIVKFRVRETLGFGRENPLSYDRKHVLRDVELRGYPIMGIIACDLEPAERVLAPQPVRYISRKINEGFDGLSCENFLDLSEESAEYCEACVFEMKKNAKRSQDCDVLRNKV